MECSYLEHEANMLLIPSTSIKACIALMEAGNLDPAYLGNSRMFTQAGLVDYLNDPRRPTTVFAPTNNAWEDVTALLEQPLTRSSLLNNIKHFALELVFAHQHCAF
eukprot:scaffold177574_cov17-Tisochrysis_lutea.AAC.2